MDAYFYIILVVGLVSTVICLAAGILKKAPNDTTILSVAAVELSLLVYLVGFDRPGRGRGTDRGGAVGVLGLPADGPPAAGRRGVLGHPGAHPLEQLRAGRRRRHRPGDGGPNESDLVLTWKRQRT